MVMSTKMLHKQWRKDFRNGVFSRDNNFCKACGKSVQDAHHITDRHEMPNGGYVLSNGISLCGDCHIKAETNQVGYSTKDLYILIKSSYEKAFVDSNNLK